MSISKGAYQALEKIVGPENISKEPAILDTYAWMYNNELHSPDHSGFAPRPGAALLPGSTEEVQAIVKVCNHYGVKVKAFSTGWIPPAQASSEDAINIDLRRMNRILEIDEKNLFAVIEPYVVSAQLQAEVMKLGLNCHVIGAGAGCSPLASATSAVGNGADGIYQGYSSETLLGMEWVMPDGNILRTGSLGSGQGWFCGEGPGPSLRGLVRGKTGVMGALGVFTKCAVKLSPWPGPAVFPVEGTIPAYHSKLPDNIKTYTLAFTSWQDYTDALYKIYDAEIGYIAHRQFSMLGEDLSTAFFAMYNDPDKSLDHLEEFVNKPEIRKLADELRHYSFQFILAGMTPGDIEYQEKVLDLILADTGGHKVAAMSEPNMEKFTALYLLKLPSKHLNYVFAGGKSQYFRPDGCPDFATGFAPVMMEILKKHQDTGLLPQAGGDCLMSTITGIGGGGDFHFEQFLHYNRTNVESIIAAGECLKDATKVGLRVSPELPPELFGMSGEELKEALAKIPGAVRFYWQGKIKQMIDPNGAGDSKSYITLEKMPGE